MADNDRKSAIQKKNTTVMWIALAVWLGASLLIQQFFIGQNPRLDAGAVFISGAAPILLISALHLLFFGIINLGLFIRVFFGVLSAAAGIGELTDLDKAVIWQPAVAGMLATIAAAVLWWIVRGRKADSA